MRPLFKRTVVHNLHIAHVHESDPSHGGIFAHKSGYIIELCAAERSGAKAEGVRRGIHNGQIPVQIRLARDDVEARKLDTADHPDEAP